MTPESLYEMVGGKQTIATLVSLAMGAFACFAAIAVRHNVRKIARYYYAPVTHTEVFNKIAGYVAEVDKWDYAFMLEAGDRYRPTLTRVFKDKGSALVPLRLVLLDNNVNVTVAGVNVNEMITGREARLLRKLIIDLFREYRVRMVNRVLNSPA